MPRLYDTVVKVDKNIISQMNELEQQLKSRGMVGIKCRFETDCIYCEGFLPLDNLQEVKHITGVLGVTLKSPDSESESD
jgi:hypothetical protein